MSWVVEEWKEGLPTKSLQKIQDLESQLDKLKKERQQRQFQLESLEAAFQKQKQKVESEKSEVVALRRENKSLIELCDSNEKVKQKLTHDYQTRETQINLLEGQLNSSKRQIEKLELELKRCKSDFEKSQQSFNAGDMSLCGTPQKSFATPITPYKYNDSRYEELEEKYNKEVDERKRIENELTMLQLKIASQSSQPSSQGMTHRDIARQQTSSSVFSWQQDRTPSRSSINSQETTLKRSFASTQCPWEKEDTPIKKGFKSDNANKSDSYNNQMADQLRAQNQELRSKINEMEMRLQAQEKDLKNQLNKFQDTQKLLEKAQMELVEKDKTLSKSRDDLARITRQFEQSTDKCELAEQKLRKVSEELSCQRQNAESARMTVEQKLKEREKENQQELLRQQNALQNMEQQLNQIKTKLSQESQQAKNDVNAIQSELDKVVQAKRLLEIETEEIKQKLCRAEKALQGSQNNEHDCKRLLEEAKSTQNAMKSQYNQKSNEALKLEEELKTRNETIKQNQLFVEEIKSKNSMLEMELKSANEKLKEQDSVDLQMLKVTLCTLEKDKDFAQELAKKRENEVKEITNTLSQIMEESANLKYQLELKVRESEELANWKNEHEKFMSQLSNEKEEMLKKMSNLDSALQSHQEQVHLLEMERKTLHTQVQTLQEIIDTKTDDLQREKNAYNELLSALDNADQKFKSENENLVTKISELRAQIEEQKSSLCADQISSLEQALQKGKLLNNELQKQCEDLLKTKMEIQTRLTEVEELYGQFVADSRNNVESLQNNISSKQNYVESIESNIKAKEEENSILSNKLKLLDNDMQSSYKYNNELNDKLQELTLRSESWAIERETWTTQISSNQRDIESLTMENNRINELNHSLNCEKTQLQKTNVDLSNVLHNRDKTISELSERNKLEAQVQLDGCRIEKENLKQELLDLTEKLYKVQEGNQQLVKVNEELTTLVHSLQNNEVSLNKTVKELRESLKEADSASKKMQVQLEMLQMDLYDKEVDMENVTEQVGKLNDTLKDAEDTVLKTKPERDLGQDELNSQILPADTGTKEKSFCLDQTEMIGERTLASLFIINNGDTSRILDMNVDDSIMQNSEHCNIKTYPDQEPTRIAESNPPSLESVPGNLEKMKELESINEELRAENLSLLNKLIEVTSKSTDIIKDVSDHKGNNIDLQCQGKGVSAAEIGVSQHQFSPPVVVYSADMKEGKPNTDGKSMTSETVAEMLIRKSPADQLQMLTGTQIIEKSELKNLLTVCQSELDHLRKQHSSEIAAWQERLEAQVKEMERKLAAEKQQTEQLSLELENARLELQCLDLSARSLLSFNCEDLTKTFEVPNQSICTVLPIGKMSLDIKDLQVNNNGRDSQPGSRSEPEGVKDTNILNGSREEVTGESNLSFGDMSETTLDNLKMQTIIEALNCLQNSNGNFEFLQPTEEGKRKGNNLLLQIQELSAQIGKPQPEPIGNEKENLELENKVQELDNERMQLLEKTELLSREKLQLTSRVGDLEKELCNISNTVEVLKVQLSEVSSIRDSFEISTGDWKEKYLQTENELRRTKSEKANIEQHALSIEADLDTLQCKYQQLQDENEGNLKSVTALQERLNIALAEKAQINQELDNLTEEKEELDQMYQKLKVRERDLESNKVNNRELIKMLEVEIRTLKVTLQAAKSLSEQLSVENDSLKHLENSGNDCQMEELQQQHQKMQEEKVLLLKESEDLQLKLSEAYSEKNLLSRSLECCQFEKHEMTTRLSSTQEEVAVMRNGIEKLKIKIESDEKKKKHMIEKLKDAERNADRLRDKIEGLERELLMSEENLESAILQSEAAKEEAEKLKMQKESFEMDVKTFRRKMVDLEKELKKSQEKCYELEATNATVSKSLEISEMKQVENEQKMLMLQTQLTEFHEQKVLSDQRSEALAARETHVVSLMEQNNAQLLQQLEEAQKSGEKLTFTVEKLTLELDECKNNLEDKNKDAEQWENKYCAAMSHFEEERESLTNGKETLQAMLDSLESKLQVISGANQSFENTIADLKIACKNFEMQLEAAVGEKSALLQKVGELEENHVVLLCKLQDADLQVKTIQESISVEKDILHEQMKTIKQQNEEHYTQLLAVTSEKLALELEECKMKLEEKARHILTLEEQVKNAGELESKYYEELSHFAAEREILKSEKENLQFTLEAKIQNITVSRDSCEVIMTGLKASCKDLEAQLEVSATEKSTLLHKIEALQEDCSSLRCKLQDSEAQFKIAEDKISLEKKTLEEQMQTLNQQNEQSFAQLIAMTSDKEELQKTIASLQLEVEMQAKQLQSDSDKQVLLDAAAKQHKGEIEHYQEQLTSAEGHLSAHKHEIDCLKASSGELAQSLCNAQKQLVEFNQLKIAVDQLKMESVLTCNNLDHWMNSCKQLEHEKEQLLNHIKKQEEALNDFDQKQKNTEIDTRADDLISEMEELKQSLEEKTLEADESIEKYCTLLIKSHKLEDSNDTLKKQVDFLSSKLKKMETSKEANSESQASLPNTSDRRSARIKRQSQGAGKQCSKRQRAQEYVKENQAQKPTTPQRLPKRMKQGTGGGVQVTAEEDQMIEPDGLPEVVKKGFADIPSGKRSPFVMRRTAVPLRTSPRLAAQRNSPSTQDLSKNKMETGGKFSSPPAGVSKPQMLNSPIKLPSDAAAMEVSSPLSAHNKLKGSASESPKSIGNMENERMPTSAQAIHEQSESEGNCHVQ